MLVSLVEDRFGECGYLTHTGIKCVWHVLELHGAAALNHLCRLLAADGFPFRLLRALNSIATDMLASPTALQVPFYFRDPVFQRSSRKHFPSESRHGELPAPCSTVSAPRQLAHAHTSLRSSLQNECKLGEVC